MRTTAGRTTPLYEFSCRSCGEDFEEWRSPGAAPPQCPSCRSGDVRRRYTTFARLKIGLRGGAARDSDQRRAEREAQRKERFAEERKRRERGEKRRPRHDGGPASPDA